RGRQLHPQGRDSAGGRAAEHRRRAGGEPQPAGPRRGDAGEPQGHAEHRRGGHRRAQARRAAEGPDRARLVRRAVVGILAAAGLMAAAPAPRPVALGALLADTPAPTLDAYRLFTDDAGREPNAGLTPYDLSTPLFSDYALKQRYLYLPPGSRVRYRAEGAFDFPVGTVLVKSFSYSADLRRPAESVRTLETRLLVRRRSGWVALAYVWNPEQTRATLKRAGARLPVGFIDPAGQPRQIDYAVPNANQCKECHAVDGEIAPIGPRAHALNRDYPY